MHPQDGEGEMIKIHRSCRQSPGVQRARLVRISEFSRLARARALRCAHQTRSVHSLTKHLKSLLVV